jgi:fructan beta-fructosidase
LKFELGDASKVGLAFGPEEVSYDVKARRLNGAPLEPVDGKISIRVLVDRPMLEICGNAGRVYITRKRASPGPSAISKVKAFVAGGHAKLVQLEVYELESIWNRENER